MWAGLDRAGGAFVVAVLWLASCAPEDVMWTTHLSVVPSDAVDCRPPGPVDRVEVRALGDFPTTDDTVATLVPDSDVEAVLDRFPVDARRLVVEATVQPDWRAAGVRVLPEGDLAGEVVLLPFGRSCPVSDPELRAPPGAAVAVAEDGAVIVAGGHADGGATRRVVRWLPGAQRGVPVGEGLHVTRTGATATPTQGTVVVAGGAQGETGVAHDTFERYDVEADAVTFGEPRLLVPRRDHGATALPGGGVLLVGGVSEGGGAPLDTAEVLDAAGGGVRAVGGTLHVPRRAPHVLTLDDGTVVVLGGRDAADAAVGVVEAFDAEADGFVQVGCALEGAEGVAVALPGARFAWITGGAAEPVRVRLGRRRPPYLPGSFDLTCTELALGPAVPALSDLRALALPDGRILVAGQGAAGPEGWLVDPGTGSATRTSASRAPSHLVSVGDGAVGELDAVGASLHRVLVRTPYDNPPATLLLGSRQGLAFDHPDHWQVEDVVFVSQAGDARVDVPSLRFADVTVELDASPTGPAAVQLLLLPEGAPPAIVEMGPDEVGPPFCTVPRVPGAPLQVSRSGTTVTVSAGGDARACTLPTLVGSVGLAIRAQPGSGLRTLRINR